jgi:hypothetical protein
MAQDQTATEWIDNYGTEAIGTGVFLQLSRDTDEFVIIFARDVNYARCMTISEEYGYSAFKWVPAQVATYAAVRASKCAAEGDPCVDTCRGLGCMCHTDRKVCVSESSIGGSSQEALPAESGSTYREREFA